MIKFSAPGKIHLLGEHAVVFGKPALLATIDLRVEVTISRETSKSADDLKAVIKKLEKVVKSKFKLKIPAYGVSIKSAAPIGAGLGSSAAISASYIAAILSFLKIRWDLDLINGLTYEAEKIFHGNPSGADNSTVIFGGLVWFRKETPEVKLTHQLPFSIPQKLAKNFILINTGIPKETTREMVGMVKNLYDKRPNLVNKFLADQEILVRELLPALKEGQEKELVRIIKKAEKNLASIGIVSKSTVKIITAIEKIGGAAKICGAGGKKEFSGILLCYHPNPSKLIQIARLNNLDYYQAALGVEGLRKE